MFEALFILTTIDSGTRVGRFILAEFMARAYKPFARPDWLPGAMISTALIVLSWGYFIFTGSIDTIWPMFGVANQLLGCVALAVATSILINTRQDALHLGHADADGVSGHEHVLRRLPEYPRQLLAQNVALLSPPCRRRGTC